MKKTIVTMNYKVTREVADALNARAQELGVDVTDVIAEAIARYLGLPSVAKFELILALASFVEATFDPANFPVDVTLRVFQHVQADPRLRSLYDAAVTGSDGTVDKDQRAVVHRAIGRMVRRRLNADVAGRSNQLDPAVHLIETHALLVPGSTRKAVGGSHAD